MRSTSLPLCLALLIGHPAIGPLAARPALAQSTEIDRENARASWRDGVAKRKAGDHAAALKLFEAAHAVMGLPTTGIEVAREREALGRLIEARDMAFSIWKMSASGPLEERAKADAHALHERLGPRIPSIEVAVSGLAAGVKVVVRVDGVELSTAVAAVPWRVNPGTHRVVVEAFGYQAEERIVELGEGVARRLEVGMRSVPAPVQMGAPTAQALPSPVPVGPWAGPVPYGIVRLHIDTTDPEVALFSRQSDGEGLRLCNAPCDQVVDGTPKKGTFFFGGEGVTPSSSFPLWKYLGDVTARVEPGRPEYRKLSILGFALGGAGVFASILGLGTANQGRASDDGLTVGFGIGIGLGVAVIAASIPLLLKGRTTYVLSTPVAGQAKTGP